jgi:hypothetical protein
MARATLGGVRSALMGSPKRAGVALATVLLCMVALALILITAMSASVSHLNMVDACTRQEHARNLADAALGKALSRLMETDFDFGSHPSDRVDVTFAGLPGAVGTVTFDPSEAGFASGYSTYNLKGDASKIGAQGRQVPGRTIHLVARGRVGDIERWMECVYYKPPFPDGLATTGWVDARSVYLAGIRRGDAYSGGDPGGIDPEQAFPANLFSNASAGASPGAPGATVRDHSRVTGSVGAIGPVSIGPECVVEGEVLPGSEPRAIPELDIEDKIAMVDSTAAPVASSGGDLTLDPNWFFKSSGPLTVNGRLDLNGSVLLTHGDLTIGGGISGTGIVLADGSVVIQDGRSHVDTGDQVAIGCRGDFTLQAEEPEGNYFQGLMYSEGDFTAKDITVVGATVVNGKNGSHGNATLDNVRFVYNPGAVEMRALPPIKFKRHAGGLDPGWAYSAISVLYRRAPDGQRWLCDVSATVCYTTRNNDEPDPRRDPGGASPRDWATLLSPHDTFSKTWTDYPVPASAPGFPVDETVLGPALASLTGEWLRDTTIRFNHHANEGDEWQRLCSQSLTGAFPPDLSQSISFNLNSLLADLMGTSRVLLWRPFP